MRIVLSSVAHHTELGRQGFARREGFLAPGSFRILPPQPIFLLNLFASASPSSPSPSIRRPSIPHSYSPFSADYPPPAPNGILRHNTKSISYSCPARAVQY